MKTRILKTIFLIAALLMFDNLLRRSIEVANKYVSLNQFDNTEFSYQLTSSIGGLQNLSYILIALALFYLVGLWAKKN